MKEIKVNVSPRLFQQYGRVPVFNEKNTSTLRVMVAVPFDKSIPSIKCVNPHGDCCGCSRPNAEDLLERKMMELN